MPTNKQPFTFNLELIYLKKLKMIAKEETRSTSNLLEHLVKLKIVEYESQKGMLEVLFDDEKE